MLLGLTELFVEDFSIKNKKDASHKYTRRINGKLRPSFLGLEGARNEKGVSFHFCFANKVAGFKPFQTEFYVGSFLFVLPTLFTVVHT